MHWFYYLCTRSAPADNSRWSSPSRPPGSRPGGRRDRSDLVSGNSKSTLSSDARVEPVAEKCLKARDILLGRPARGRTICHPCSVCGDEIPSAKRSGGSAGKATSTASRTRCHRQSPRLVIQSTPDFDWKPAECSSQHGEWSRDLFPLGLLLLAGGTICAQQFDQTPDDQKAAQMALPDWSTASHISQKKIDDDISKKTLKRYIESVDPLKLYFTRSGHR